MDEQLSMLSSPLAGSRSPQFAVHEGRLSLERLLDEAGHNGSKTEVLDVFGQTGPNLARAMSAKQLDDFKSLPSHSSFPGAPSDFKQVETANGAELMAKLQEQLMPWLKQQMQELLANSATAVSVGGTCHKEESARDQEDMVTRAASSIAEALPSVLAKQFRDSQELSMAGSVCAPKTEQHGLSTEPQAKVLAASADSGASGNVEDSGQQVTSALKPAQHVSRTDSFRLQQHSTSNASTERPVKRACRDTIEKAQSALEFPQEEMNINPSHISKINLANNNGWDMDVSHLGSGARKRRTNYVKLQELEANIQEGHVIEHRLRQAIRHAELQHVAILEENRQLWSAVAHINATIHAGHISLVLTSQKGTKSQPAQKDDNHVSSASESEQATGNCVGGRDLSDMFGASPDPMCLAEACGMLFSPALATKVSIQQLPINKPRKLFEDDLAAATACHGKQGSIGELPNPLKMEKFSAPSKTVIWGDVVRSPTES